VASYNQKRMCQSIDFCGRSHFGVRVVLGIFVKKTPKRTWLCAGIATVQ